LTTHELKRANLLLNKAYYHTKLIISLHILPYIAIRSPPSHGLLSHSPPVTSSFFFSFPLNSKFLFW
jgi:hypothetical protein